MLRLTMLQTFNAGEMYGIWFMIAVTSLIVAWIFDWLMQKTGIGMVGGSLATAGAVIGGLHLAERFIVWNWHRNPLAGDIPVIVGIVAGTVVVVVLGLSLLKRKLFDA